MTFEEAYEALNEMRHDEVAKEMVTWHPAVLGEMLRAVQEAKSARYPGPHPDYESALAEIAAVDPRF